MAEAMKVSGIGFHLHGVHTPRRVCSQILVLWLPHFCMRQLKIPKIWRRALIVAIPKPENQLGDPKSYRPTSFQNPREARLRSCRTNHRPIAPSEHAFDTGGRPLTRSPCWHRTSRIAFRLKRKPGLCLLTSQQPVTLYGTGALRASCCDCCLIDTFTWSSRWLVITALPLPPETAKEAGYDASRTVSHRDLSWRPFSSISTSLSWVPPSPESMYMLTI